MGAGPKHARVYFRRDGKQLIVVTVHQSPNGGLVEADGPLSLTRWDDEALGESIQTALDQSTATSKAAPAFPMPGGSTLQASGEPSPRAFDATFIRVEIFGAGATCTIQAGPEKDNLTIFATLPSQAPSTDFARQTTRIFQICRDRKF